MKPISDAQEEIAVTPARTIAGVLVKLRLYADLNSRPSSHSATGAVVSIDQRPLDVLDLDQAAVVGAMRDLERLSKGAGEGAIISKSTASGGYSDLHRLLTESAEKGNEKAQFMLDEDFDWRNMSFVRCHGTKTAIQWPPVQLTSEDKVLIRGAACVIGNHCALDLIGHIKSHSKNYDGDRLLEIAQEIVKCGEWGGLEIGFFSALGNFMVRGRIPTSADFDPVLTGEGAVMTDKKGYCHTGPRSGCANRARLGDHLAPGVAER